MTNKKMVLLLGAILLLLAILHPAIKGDKALIVGIIGIIFINKSTD